MSYQVIISYILLIAAFIPLLCCSIEIFIPLERAVPLSGLANLTHLVQRDRVRHGHHLRSTSDGVINYTLGGTGDLSVGLYYTRLQLGTPPRDYHVQVDTGSDVTWLGCTPCKYCPKTTWIKNISLHRYNPAASSTFSALSCYEKRCPGVRAPAPDCLVDSAHYCRYWIDYADHSHVYGYYAQELITYDISVGNSTVTSTAPFIFGCATVASGFSRPSSTDGILGLGHLGVSLISQFADQGLGPKIFSHCLSGDRDGGGILVIGEVTEPDIIYSPLIPSQDHYNLELQKVSVNGHTLPIDPQKFSGTSEPGVMVDSGTTLAYFSTEAFYQVSSAINASTTARSVMSPEYPCYQVDNTSVDKVFPPLILHFAGGADLVLGPRDYLLYTGLMDGAALWCTSFRPAEQNTVIGDVFLKNRLFVYDLVGQRIGWTYGNHNCSATMKVSTGKHKNRSSSTRMPVQLHLVVIMIFMSLGYLTILF